MLTIRYLTNQCFIMTVRNVDIFLDSATLAVKDIKDLEGWEKKIIREYIDHEYMHKIIYNKFKIPNEIIITLEKHKNGIEIDGITRGNYYKKYKFTKNKLYLFKIRNN